MMLVNQSDQMSRHGTGKLQDNNEFKDLKNKLVNLSNSKPVPHHHNQVGKVKNFSAGFDASQLLQYAEGVPDADNSDMLRGETVQSIEDATGRLSNLVRLMDENSKLNQPSDLTVQSYKSSIIAAGGKNEYSDHNQGEEAQKMGSFSKQLNSFFVSKDENQKAESSFEQTREIIEDLLKKDDDNKLFKQLDDLRFGSFARKLNRAKTNYQTAKVPKKKRTQYSGSLDKNDR